MQHCLAQSASPLYVRKNLITLYLIMQKPRTRFIIQSPFLLGRALILRQYPTFLKGERANNV